jgi:transcriptional regulator GlxA family with amidase domain
MERLKFRRLEAARSLIEQRSPKLSMTDIAMKSGFSSSSEFSRLFKNEFGVAPSRF